MTVNSPSEISDLEQRRTDRVLDMLDWWSERFSGHFTQKREHPRKRFRARISIYVQGNENAVCESSESAGFTVQARNISAGGISLLFREQIKGDNLVLCLNPDHGGTQWYQGVIVRRRAVHDGFWEFGVRFTGKATM